MTQIAREEISVFNHPSNTDPSAKIVGSTLNTRGMVYQVRGGYVATFGNGHCYAGLYQSQGDAEFALDCRAAKLSQAA